MQRMDVYNDEDEYMLPINAELENDRITYNQDRTHQQFRDALIDGDLHGSNYYDNDYKEVCVLMKGEGSYSKSLLYLLIYVFPLFSYLLYFLYLLIFSIFLFSLSSYFLYLLIFLILFDFPFTLVYLVLCYYIFINQEAVYAVIYFFVVVIIDFQSFPLCLMNSISLI